MNTGKHLGYFGSEDEGVKRTMTVQWVDVREEATGWLLFRYDPRRQLVEIKQRGRKVLVDLTEFEKLAVSPLDRGGRV